MSEYTVLWDGSRKAPNGPYLFAEEEAPPVPKEPIAFRTHRDLTVDEIGGLLTEYAAGCRPCRLADRYGVSVDTVRFLVTLATSGMLQRTAEATA